MYKVVTHNDGRTGQCPQVFGARRTQDCRADHTDFGEQFNTCCLGDAQSHVLHEGCISGTGHNCAATQELRDDECDPCLRDIGFSRREARTWNAVCRKKTSRSLGALVRICKIIATPGTAHKSCSCCTAGGCFSFQSAPLKPHTFRHALDIPSRVLLLSEILSCEKA